MSSEPVRSPDGPRSTRASITGPLLALAVALSMLLVDALLLRRPMTGDDCFGTGLGLLFWAVLSSLVAAGIGSAILVTIEAAPISYILLVVALAFAARAGYRMGTDATGCLSLSAQEHPDSTVIIAVMGLVGACVGLAPGYLVGRVIRVVRHR